MANVMELLEIVQAAKPKFVSLDRDSCLSVRNRNAKCTKCMDSCPSEAINIQFNNIDINHDICVACGSCATACPTGSIESIQPSRDDIVENCKAFIGEGASEIYIACSRIASKHLVSADRIVEVPCLAMIDESILLEAAVEGCEKVYLVDGSCATCRNVKVNESINSVAGLADYLLAVCENICEVIRTSEFPQDLLIEDLGAKISDSRRDFFTKLGSNVFTGAKSAVKVGIDQKLNSSEQRASIALPRFNDGYEKLANTRSSMVLDCIEQLGGLKTESIDTRLFATIDIDLDKCKACSMCEMFCPSGAILMIGEKPTNKPRFNLLASVAEEKAPEHHFEFLASSCISCNTCVNICMGKCMSMNTSVLAAELFSAQPKVIGTPVDNPGVSATKSS